MNINIVDLLPIQQKVNSVVSEKLETDLTSQNYILAFNIELFEYFNAIGVWKWWKHNHVIEKEKVLDELADCFAFFLSAVIYQDQNAMFENKDLVSPKVEKELNDIFVNIEKYRKESDMTDHEVIDDLITYVGTDNEDKGVVSVERFAIAIFIATILFEKITWEEITEAYRKKSNVNIKRQRENY